MRLLKPIKHFWYSYQIDKMELMREELLEEIRNLRSRQIPGKNQNRLDTMLEIKEDEVEKLSMNIEKYKELLQTNDKV